MAAAQMSVPEQVRGLEQRWTSDNDLQKSLEQTTID